jgi:hypothetical protein
MNGTCEGCGKSDQWLIPLHGDRGGPLRCFMCAGEWNALYTRRRKWGRIIIKAMRMYLKEGGRYADLDKLKTEASLGGVLDISRSGLGLGYGATADTIGTDVPDITSELLEDVLQLVHPDRHPVERQVLAKRVSQELLALKPFVFPAPKPPPPVSKEDTAVKRQPEKPASERSKEKGSLPPAYPCELCAEHTPYFYCDRCKAEWDKRRREKTERERAKHRRWYAARKERKAYYAKLRGEQLTPKPTTPKPRTVRQSIVAVNQVPPGNLNNQSLNGAANQIVRESLDNHSLSGLQAAILVAAYTKRVPGSRGCDISNPELFVEVWGWKTTRNLRWTKERAAKMTDTGDYRVGDTLAARDTHGAFNHIPSDTRRSASASLSRALKRLEKVEAAAAERSTITRTGLIEMAKEVYVQARESGQSAAAVAALKEIGVLSGIRIERSERGHPHEFDWLEKLSVEDLRLLAAGELDVAQFQPSAGSGRQSVN